jgi:predicted DNA-binding transcriptional regulator AlpA
MDCISESDLAARWGISRRTLQRWRQERQGPKYLKLGGRVAYEFSEIKTYEDLHRKGVSPVGKSDTPSPRKPGTSSDG